MCYFICHSGTGWWFCCCRRKSAAVTKPNAPNVLKPVGSTANVAFVIAMPSQHCYHHDLHPRSSSHTSIPDKEQWDKCSTSVKHLNEDTPYEYVIGTTHIPYGDFSNTWTRWPNLYLYHWLSGVSCKVISSNVIYRASWRVFSSLWVLSPREERSANYVLLLTILSSHPSEFR